MMCLPFAALHHALDSRGTSELEVFAWLSWREITARLCVCPSSLCCMVVPVCRYTFIIFITFHCRLRVFVVLVDEFEIHTWQLGASW